MKAEKLYRIMKKRRIKLHTILKTRNSFFILQLKQKYMKSPKQLLKDHKDFKRIIEIETANILSGNTK